MKIAIIGYGKMGREIEKHAPLKQFEIVTIIDNEVEWEQKAHLLKSAEAAIEFTSPEIAPENIKQCIKLGVPVVSGTTGWTDKWDEIRQFCIRNNGTLVYSANFSIGMNIFFYLNRKAALIMNRFPEYNIRIREIHHVQKLDQPSGTAIKLANDILDIHPEKSAWVNDKTTKPEELEILSVRQGQVTGTHEIRYTSAIDEIELKHQAFSREGFANGALLAASWIKNKKGVFSMNDVLELS